MPLQLLSAGSNAQGQLGQNHLEDSYTFQSCLFGTSPSKLQSQLPFDTVISLSCGANHTCLLVGRKDSEGHTRELWGSGDGKKGQLGLSNTSLDAGQGTNQTVFHRIDDTILTASGIQPTDYRMEHVVASWESTFIYLRPRTMDSRLSKGILLSIGNNDYGDLGIGLSPSQLGKTSHPQRVPLEDLLSKKYSFRLTGYDVRKLVAGLHHVVAIVDVFLDGPEASDSVVIGWGTYRQGQLGYLNFQTSGMKGKSKIPSYTTEPKVLQFPRDGWGDSKILDIAVGSSHTLLLLDSCKVVALGSNKKGQLDGVNEATGITGVHCSWNGCCLIRNPSPAHKNVDWSIYSSGRGEKGQLGRSDSAPSVTVSFPFASTSHALIGFACGSEHSLALFRKISNNIDPMLSVEEVWGWGWNEHGNLGLGHTDDVHSPSLIWTNAGGSFKGSHVDSVWAGCGTSWIVLMQES